MITPTKKRILVPILLMLLTFGWTFSQIEVESDGNVLIGNALNTSPVFTKGLTVYGNIYGPTTLGNESSLVGFKNIKGRSGDGILHLQGGVDGGLVLLNHAHNGNIIMANGGGNVHVGSLYQTLGRNDKLFVNGSVSATQGYWEPLWSSSSSKGNRNDNTIDALTTINSIQPFLVANPNVSIDKEAKYGLGVDKSLIAQISYALKEDGQGGYLVNYNAMIPLLLAGLKELNSRIEELENLKIEIENLNSQNSNFQIDSSVSKKSVELYQNVPNPYSGSTEINYYLGSEVKAAKLNIYDLQGSQKQSIQIMERGYGSVEVKKGSLPIGVYLYNLIVDGQFTKAKKMIVFD